MSQRRAPRSVCPIAGTLDLIGDRWTLLVIRDLFAGRTQFKEFAGSPEGIATNILSQRLARLVEAGIIEQVPLPEKSGRHGYHLTDKGLTLRPVLQAVADWGLEHIEGTAIQIRPTT